MVDSKHELLKAPKADPNELLLAEVDVRNSDPKKKPREASAGEVAFDRVVYTGIGFGVNEASAIVIADEFENGIGKKWFEKISEVLVKKLNYKDVIKNGEMITAKAQASNMLLWGSLLISGTALILPMKELEDNKGYWVKKLNHFADKIRGNTMTKDQVEERDLEVEKNLACEPRQTWPSMLIGRGIAIVTALGLGAALGSKRSQGIMDWTERSLTGSVQAKGMKNWKHRYAAVAGLETISCGATSIALEMTSKLFAKRGVTVRDPEACTALVHEKEATANGGSTSSSGQADATGTQEKTTQATAPQATAPVKETTIKEPVGGPKETDILETTVKEPITATGHTTPSELEDKLAKYKKKPLAKMDSHVDAAQASKDTGFSLAP